MSQNEEEDDMDIGAGQQFIADQILQNQDLILKEDNFTQEVDVNPNDQFGLIAPELLQFK